MSLHGAKTVKMETVCFSETASTYKSTRCQNPEEEEEQQQQHVFIFVQVEYMKFIRIINKIFSGYQPCQLVKNRRFRDQLRPHHQDLM
jgi:hypothetical protein